MLTHPLCVVFFFFLRGNTFSLINKKSKVMYDHICKRTKLIINSSLHQKALEDGSVNVEG